MKEPATGPPPERRLPFPFVLALASSLVVTILIAQRQILFGSFEGNWLHPYYRSFSPQALHPFLVAAPSVLLLGVLTLRHASRPAPTLLAWLAAASLLQLAFRSQFPGTLAANVESDLVNSFYGATLAHPPYELMRNFESIQPSLPLHAAVNMPGKVMLFYLLGAVTESPQTMAYLLIALSNLGGVLLYLVVEDLFEDRRSALYACILYLFLPCRLFLLPRLNTVSPLLLLLCLLLFLRYLRSPRAPWAVSLGVCLYGTLFFDPLPLASGLVFLALLAGRARSSRLTRRSIGRLAVACLAGFLAVHAAMLALFHYDVFGHFLRLLTQAVAFNPRAERAYAVWVVQNPVDFLVNAGVASSVLFFAFLARLARERRAAVWARPPALFALSTLAVFAGLDLAGVNRGEVIRLWIFLASLWVVVPAHYCARQAGSLPFYAVLLATLLQASVTINMVRFGIV